MQSLPIDNALPRIVEALRHSPNLVLEAPPGAGKTTRVPGALLDAGLTAGQRIVVLQPRRIAARAAARRTAIERNVRLGDEVGYAVRFDRKYSANTSILFATDGLFFRMLREDPFLQGVGAVVFDEFHERGIDSDLSIALTRSIQRDVRPDLRIVAMSATLEAGPISEFLGGCPVISSAGSRFDVEIEYAKHEVPASLQGLERSVREAVASLLRSTAGDLLVFLPGVGEIRRCREDLVGAEAAADAIICELYGDLPAERQDEAIRAASRRKIILATNVAETSITVENVGGVVDSGWARVLRHDSRVGLNRLELCRISKASARQRAGRAGRTATGKCIRLWSATQHARLAEQEPPEIQRVDLAAPALQLVDFGESDLRRFVWFEPPPPASLEKAMALLHLLGALDKKHRLTPTGRQMARLPAHPRLARMLIEAHRQHVVRKAACAAALLSERDPFAGSRRPASHVSDSDVLDRVDALTDFLRTGRSGDPFGRLYEPAARFILQSADQLARETIEELGTGGKGGKDSGQRDRSSSSHRREGEAIGRSLLAAYPDRLCKRREPGSRKGLMAGGRGVSLHPSSAVTAADLFVAVDASASGADDLVFLASAVRREWLASDFISVSEDLYFDETNRRVWGRRQSRWLDLVIDETQVNPTDAARVGELLAGVAAERLAEAFSVNSEEFVRLSGRVAFLRHWMPELELPPLDENWLRSQTPQICSGRRSFAELRRIDLCELYLGLLSYAQRTALDREAPPRIDVPSGSKIAVEYPKEKPPILAVRIQELFGLEQTPRLAAGRVPVLLHLLGPNHRPQQITDDLASFWKNTYPVVRKDLRGRYPKHAWPEDPLQAPAQRRPKPRA